MVSRVVDLMAGNPHGVDAQCMQVSLSIPIAILIFML